MKLSQAQHHYLSNALELATRLPAEHRETLAQQTQDVLQGITIVVKLVRSHGLDTYEVRVNGTLLNTFMSREHAERKAQAYKQRWGVK